MADYLSLSGSSLSRANFELERLRRTTHVVVTCDRCGAATDADRIDVTTLGGPREFIWGRITCVTAGCVDEYGSAAVEPPDEPGQLTREDRRWLRRQREFLAEYERVSRDFADLCEEAA